MEKSEARVVEKANKPLNPFTWKSEPKDINRRDNANNEQRLLNILICMQRNLQIHTLSWPSPVSKLHQELINHFLDWCHHLLNFSIHSVFPNGNHLLQIGPNNLRHCGHLIFHQLHLQILLWLVNVWCCLLTFEWLAPCSVLSFTEHVSSLHPPFILFYVCLASYLMQTFHGYLRRKKQMEIWGEAKGSSGGISPLESKFTMCCSDAQPSVRLRKRPNTCNMPDTERERKTQRSPSPSLCRSILIGALHRI